MINNISTIQALYYAWDLFHKKSTSDDSKFTGVLSEAKVDLNPHQVDAALFAFKSPLSKGAILADEVGLGKTIEAGIILSECWAEHKRKILIVVPASLRPQWHIELMEKFHLPSVILEANLYNDMKKEGGLSLDKGETIFICSYNFAIKHAEEFSAIGWDLVVFDEAHKMRNVYKRGNLIGNTMRETFKYHKKILLTATPLQNNLKELYGLISIIDSNFFLTVDNFDKQYNAVSTRDNAKYGELKSRLAPIVHRTLRRQVKEYVNYTKRIAFVQEFNPSDAELELYDEVNDYLRREGTFGVPDKVRPMLTLIVRKIMSSSAYALGFTLERFIKRLEDYKRTGIMSSVLSAVMNDYEVSKDEEPVLIDVEADSSIALALDDEIEELRGLRRQASLITNETKAEKLLIALEETFKKNDKLGAPRKALIFTESRRTQEFLESFLKEHGYCDKIVCFNGTNDDESAKSIYRRWLSLYAGTSRISGNLQIDKKQALVDFFRTEAEIMIATESAAEGMNMQFCSLVVNYDLPWNPQRIEQRIGRCHRYGQKFDVVVVNFVNQQNKADCRVYELLNDKFNLFNGVFGCSDEVLGSIESCVDFEKKLNEIYQTCRTDREIEAAFNALQEELDDLIQKRIKDTKKTLLENFDEEVVDILKAREQTDRIRVNTYCRHFWNLATFILHQQIDNVNQEKLSFHLNRIEDEKIPLGTYMLNKEHGSNYPLRVSHPLGEYILQHALKLSVCDSVLDFSLDKTDGRHMYLEQYNHQSGVAVVFRVKVHNDYDSEEHLLFCGQTDQGELLNEDFIKKLLEVPVVSEKPWLDSDGVDGTLASIYEKDLEKLKRTITDRLGDYINYEIDKFQAWSNDQVYLLEEEVIELRKQNEKLRRAVRKERNVSEKLRLQEEQSKISKQLRQKQHLLYEKLDECEAKVDDMTERLRKAMENKFETDVFFRIRWNLVGV